MFDIRSNFTLVFIRSLKGQIRILLSPSINFTVHWKQSSYFSFSFFNFTKWSCIRYIAPLWILIFTRHSIYAPNPIKFCIFSLQYNWNNCNCSICNSRFWFSRSEEHLHWTCEWIESSALWKRRFFVRYRATDNTVYVCRAMLDKSSFFILTKNHWILCMDIDRIHTHIQHTQ